MRRSFNQATSDDEGNAWSELRPISEFGDIVAMASLHRQAGGDLLAFRHDDGRFLRNEDEADAFHVYAPRLRASRCSMSFGGPEFGFLLAGVLSTGWVAAMHGIVRTIFRSVARGKREDLDALGKRLAELASDPAGGPRAGGDASRTLPP